LVAAAVFTTAFVVFDVTVVFLRTGCRFEGIASAGIAKSKTTNPASTIRQRAVRTLKSVIKTKSFLALFRT
jgi:hypothetical protein